MTLSPRIEGTCARRFEGVREAFAANFAGGCEVGAAGALDPESLLGKGMGNPAISPEVANRRPWRAAEIPAANGHGNARSVARVLSALACGGTLNGVRLLGEKALARALEEQSHGRDLVLGVPLRWGLGFMLTSETLPLGPSPRCFGHGGWGGSLGDTRGARLVAALYAAL